MLNCIRRTLSFGLVVCLVALCAPMALGQDSGGKDVIHLKDGTVVTGKIIGDMTGETIKMQLEDGSVAVYNMSDVAKIVPYTPPATPTIAPVAAPAAPAATPVLRSASYKSSGTAMLYSLLITGGGQFYNGESSKGLLMLGASVVGVVLFVAYFPTEEWVADDYYWASYGYTSESGNATLAYGGLAVALGASIWSIIDASAGAKRANQRNGFGLLPGVSDNVSVNLATLNVDGETAPGVKLRLTF